ncbi:MULTISPECIES: sugar dehydrogenase complex small subunit [unclassified Tatumella]|uniref:sugar dehydrogenase complex small subunit n=1 Tax=unclassified Tatumella TaxID=2649542 RepID=UPI001BAF063D|nr:MULTISPECIES: sugar dehydrogenase complex small subunit [unclassified Tatumella]MBS0877688.1 sorbitol dehydrogenase family protein [Tatumella sp. JGM82]MBS0891393.1 sorbitol dehydrogenase family protein [Tatumella sp. JGM94]MBS0895382.1 sorbitol dehydrogenase family protein [Tatumella sp. JGM130]MBS0902221.1 sorbitol dehydrogenase family protein [Tatumella sp. JGM100]
MKQIFEQSHTDLPASGTGSSRRGFIKSALILTAGSLAASLPLQSFASSLVHGGDTTQDFISVSQAITEHKHINPQLATHFLSAFIKRDNQFSSKITRLAQLRQPGDSAIAFRQKAIDAGLGDFLQQILTAWYTGTIGDDYKGTLVAYKQALMYDTVSDGLVVPTYCGNGPLWWTAPVPDPLDPELINNL